MKARRPKDPVTLSAARRGVAEAMAVRRGEIEAAISARAFAISPAEGREAPGYAEGLRAAISAGFEMAILAIGEGSEEARTAPPAILAQARAAARSRVGLETVLRRYAASYSVLIDTLLEEIRRGDPAARAVESILQGELTKLFDLLVEMVGAEYRSEGERLARSSTRRRAELLEELLAGASVDGSALGYDFDGHHLGAIVTGPDRGALLRRVAGRLDRALLLLDPGEGPISAWLGGVREFDVEELAELARSEPGCDAGLALGEPQAGLAGWRRTHRQARAAHDISIRRPRPFTRYGKVALLATASRDEDLTSFLREAFLARLDQPRYRDRALAATIRAYLDAGCSVSAAAAALGVARQTVTIRLRVIEEEIGRPVDDCLAELDMALRLDELDR